MSIIAFSPALVPPVIGADLEKNETGSVVVSHGFDIIRFYRSYASRWCFVSTGIVGALYIQVTSRVRCLSGGLALVDVVNPKSSKRS